MILRTLKTALEEERRGHKPKAESKDEPAEVSPSFSIRPPHRSNFSTSPGGKNFFLYPFYVSFILLYRNLGDELLLKMLVAWLLTF